MAYAVLSDLTVFGLMSATLATIDQVTQNRHLSAASGFIDSYLNVHFTLPLKSWDDGLIQKCCEIAAGTLLGIRGYDPEDEGDQSIMKRYEIAQAWLVEIKNGELTPVVIDSSPIQGQPSGPNTLQMTTEQVTTQASTGSLTFVREDSSGGQVFVGAPRQRGWR